MSPSRLQFEPTATHAIRKRVAASSLRKNILALQLLQLSGVAIPLVTQPWIARALGPTEYGHYSFILAVTTYFSLLSEFGFNWSGTRALSVYRDDRAKASGIICSVYAAKLLLCFCGAMVLFVCASAGLFRAELAPLLVSYMSVLGLVLVPAWYFQAIERSYVIAMGDLTTRLLAVPFVLWLVRSSSDMVRALAITAGTQLIVGVVGVSLMLSRGEIEWHVPTWQAVLGRIREGFPLFLSTAVISLYTTTTSVVVGSVAGREQLGYFSAAQKLVNAASSVLAPIGQAIYPRISSHFARDAHRGFALVRLALGIFAVAGIVLTGSLLIFPSWIVGLLFGHQFRPAVAVVRLLSPVPTMLAFAITFANLVMIPLGQDSKHLRMVGLAAAVHILTVFPLVAGFGAKGAAVAVDLAELVVLVYSGVCAYGLFRRHRLEARPA